MMNINKIRLMTACVGICLLTLNLQAQNTEVQNKTQKVVKEVMQPLKKYFVVMPDSLCPLLSAVNRADFVDFLDSKMRAKVTNKMGGTSEMTVLTSDFLSVDLSERSQCQMKLLPVNDSTSVIGCLSLVSGPALDSHFCFYTTDWKKLPTEQFLSDLPDINDFILSKPDTLLNNKYEEICKAINLRFMKAAFSSKDKSLVFSLDTESYLDKETSKLAKPLLRSSIKYYWVDGKFRKE